MKFRVRIDTNLCKGCSLCVEACVREVLEMSERLNASGQAEAEVQRPEKCQGCCLCSEICPEAAITIERCDPRADSNSADADSAPGEK